MGKFINGVLFLGAILAIFVVLSGYKENFELPMAVRQVFFQSW